MIIIPILKDGLCGTGVENTPKRMAKPSEYGC